jgi:hypothetical protein
MLTCKIADHRLEILKMATSIPCAKCNIEKLKSARLPKGERFETSSDAKAESARSESVLSGHQPGTSHSMLLRECRAGDYDCERPYCPKCARVYRRFLIGELLRLQSSFDGRVRILVVLLETSPKGKISDLDFVPHHHSLRKRLSRAGLSNTPVIGGFEMVYRARTKEWVLHVNLVIFGGDAAAINGFKGGFSDSNAVREDRLNDSAKQLSYVLKFTTYHRPHQQRGPKKAKAVPLNPSEHFELVQWMAQHAFTDHVFLFNARRRGASIELASKPARKA